MTSPSYLNNAVRFVDHSPEQQTIATKLTNLLRAKAKVSDVATQFGCGYRNGEAAAWKIDGSREIQIDNIGRQAKDLIKQLIPPPTYTNKTAPASHSDVDAIRNFIRSGPSSIDANDDDLQDLLKDDNDESETDLDTSDTPQPSSSSNIPQESRHSSEFDSPPSHKVAPSRDYVHGGSSTYPVHSGMDANAINLLLTQANQHHEREMLVLNQNHLQVLHLFASRSEGCRGCHVHEHEHGANSDKRNSLRQDVTDLQTRVNNVINDLGSINDDSSNSDDSDIDNDENGIKSEKLNTSTPSSNHTSLSQPYVQQHTETENSRETYQLGDARRKKKPETNRVKPFDIVWNADNLVKIAEQEYNNACQQYEFQLAAKLRKNEINEMEMNAKLEEFQNDTMQETMNKLLVKLSDLKNQGLLKKSRTKILKNFPKLVMQNSINDLEQTLKASLVNKLRSEFKKTLKHEIETISSENDKLTIKEVFKKIKETTITNPLTALNDMKDKYSKKFKNKLASAVKSEFLSQEESEEKLKNFEESMTQELLEENTRLINLAEIDAKLKNANNLRAEARKKLAKNTKSVGFGSGVSRNLALEVVPSVKIKNCIT